MSSGHWPGGTRGHRFRGSVSPTLGGDELKKRKLHRNLYMRVAKPDGTVVSFEQGITLGRDHDPCDPAASMISRAQCRIERLKGRVATLSSTGLHPTMLIRRGDAVPMLLVGQRAQSHPELLAENNFFTLVFSESVQLADGDQIGLIGAISTRFFVFHSGAPGLRCGKREERLIDSEDDNPRKRQKQDGGAAFGGQAAEGCDDSPAFMPWRPLWTEELGCGPGNAGAVKLEEIVGGPKPDWVVISNYMIDVQWLMTAWPSLKMVKRVVIFHGDSCKDPGGLLPKHFERHARCPKDIPFFRRSKGKQRAKSEAEGSPWSNNYGCHHSKFFLLGYPTGLRFALLTANLISHDQHSKSQGVYVQDFPRKPTGQEQSSPTSDFEEVLRDYADSLMVHGGPASEQREWPGWNPQLHAPANLEELLGRYDYTAAYGSLVPTVPGYHVGQERQRYGHLRVKALLEAEGNRFDLRFTNIPAWKMKMNSKLSEHAVEGSKVVCQFSSFSNAKDRLRDQLASSFSAGSNTNGVRLGSAALEFVWPTCEELRSGIMGYNAGSALPGTAVNVATAPREMFRSWTLTGAGPGEPSASSGRSEQEPIEFVRARRVAMPHIKSYMRMGQSCETLAWFCLTSANMSKAAWGDVQSPPERGEQLFCCHWELGVLFSPLSLSRGAGDTFSVAPSAPRQFYMGGKVATEGQMWRLLTPHGWRQRRDEHALGIVGGAGCRDVLFPLPFECPTVPYPKEANPWTSDSKGLPADRFGHTDCSGTKNYGNDAAFRIDNEDYARSSIAETAAIAMPTAVREPQKEHVVALLVDAGDQDFQEFMQSCQDACDSVVHKCCFQWPQTRHITLWDLTLTLTLIGRHFTLWEGQLTSTEAAHVRFRAFQAPQLPIKIGFNKETPWKDWRYGLYLQPDDESGHRLAEAFDATRDLEGLPAGKTKNAKQLHLSVYRKRTNPNAMGEFPRIRDATKGRDPGTVRGIRVIIKEVGGPWEAGHMRDIGGR